MTELRQLYGSLGFNDVRTYMQSGNILFGHPRVGESALSWQIENALKERFNLQISVIIRAARDLRKLVEENPLRGRDETKLHVSFTQT